MSTMKRKQLMNQQVSQRGWGAARILLCGILGMIIAMGIGRFAYTPILPLMQRDLGLSNIVAGWLASLNYLGYLAGAILCSFAPQFIRSRYVAFGTLLISITTTTVMGLTESAFWWGNLRFASGLVSALLFIIISAEIAEALLWRGYGHWSGAIYSGVGAGIAFSGLAIPWLDNLGQWAGSWLGMGVIATILAIVVLVAIKGQMSEEKSSPKPSDIASSMRSIWPLVVAYFFEGLGYIVTATFIVAIVAKTPGLERYAPYSWVAVGLAAIPSTIFWPHLARYIGRQKALLAAYVLQATGILASIHADSIMEITFAAVTFGGTFMGITALTLAEGSSRVQTGSGRAAAILTASFGVGQILGPTVAGFLSDQQGDFTLALSLAALSVVIGAILSATDRYFVQHKQRGESPCHT